MSNSFENVPTVSGQELAVQQHGHQQQGVVAIEQSRAVAEAQARLVVAASRPRNEITARTRVLQACDRLSLAQVAVYQYPRGGLKVTGPSIRLAEVAARSWGNMDYGFREVGRTQNESEIEAFAWDLETNTRATRTFKVRHWRDTKKGGHEITEERDKYELVANMAQRRVRACILEIVPGDIIEDAVTRCERTVKAHVQGEGKRPMREIISDMVDWFSQYGVTAEMIEAKLGHSLEATTPQEIITLRGIGTSLKDGMSDREDWFDVTGAKPKAKPAPTTPPPAEATGSDGDDGMPGGAGDDVPPPAPNFAEPTDYDIRVVTMAMEGMRTKEDLAVYAADDLGIMLQDLAKKTKAQLMEEVIAVLKKRQQ